MKFVKGPIPVDMNFEPLEEGWVPLKEPDLKRVQLLALPLIPVLVLMIYMVSSFLGFNFKAGIISILTSLIIVIPVHEVIHALAFPDSLTSDKVILGYYPKMKVFFAHYEGEMTRNRFILALVSPFLVISILLLVLGAILILSHL